MSDELREADAGVEAAAMKLALVALETPRPIEKRLYNALRDVVTVVARSGAIGDACEEELRKAFTRHHDYYQSKCIAHEAIEVLKEYESIKN